MKPIEIPSEFGIAVTLEPAERDLRAALDIGQDIFFADVEKTFRAIRAAQQGPEPSPEHFVARIQASANRTGKTRTVVLSLPNWIGIKQMQRIVVFPIASSAVLAAITGVKP